MMIKNYYLWILPFCCLIGILVFAFHKNIIIFNNGQKLASHQIAKIATKKKITFFYWNGHECTPETLILITSDCLLDNLEQIISSWAHLLLNEKIIKKNVSLENVLINAQQTDLYVNFDRVPWNKECSTYEKWMIVESLLRTIKTNAPSIKKVQLLENHTPLSDVHLDFSKPWPIEGFI